MTLHAKTSLPALLLGLSLAGNAWAGHDHFHNVAPAAGHAVEQPHSSGAPHGSVPMPNAGGHWHNLPPAAARGAYFASSAPGHYQHYWGHGDIHYFPYHDRYYWDHGYWNHAWYGGRYGWWWVVSGVWFFYPVPIYPYPDPYVPASFDAPPPPSGVAVAATSQFWYFCPASNAYYPYVPACPTGWQQVPATPATDQQQTQPPPPPNPPPPGG